MIQLLQTTANQQGGGWMTWGMLILMFAVVYLFMIRPQRKQQKKIEEMRAALKKGDKVITAGGIYGTIVEVEEKSILIKVDGETKLRVDKSCVNKDSATDNGETSQK